tara:strand:+ start:1436 stop:1723 length:288 start_codon:yes stop_codon:yes gene_type:complete
MSTTNIGNPIQGRRLKGGNSGQEPIEIKADNGDESTANSATPFLKFTNASTGTGGSTENGSFNITTEDVGSNSDAFGILVQVNGTKCWLQAYATA